MARKLILAKVLRGQMLTLLIACQFCAATCTTEVFAGAFDQLRSMSGGGAVYIPPVNGPSCVGRCEGSGGDDRQNSGYGGPSLFDRINQWQEQQTREHKQEAFNLNEQGNRAFEKRDWEASIDLYKQALDKSPDDKVIRENLRRAEQERQSQKELSRERSEYRRRMEKLLAVMPTAKPLSQAARATRPAVVPLPGFSTEQWKEYLAAQETVAVLYARLNQNGALSDADAATFYQALHRRNELWARAAEQPRSDEERDNLRLPLPRVVSKSLLNSVMRMIQQESRPDTPSVSASESPDRRLASAADSKFLPADPITTAFVADFFAGKGTVVIESETGDAIKEARGKKFAARYEKMLAVGSIAVEALKGGTPAAGAETADLIVAKIPKPLGPHAEFAVEGGRMYSKVAYQSLNRFMVDAMNATGSSFDSEAFWKRFNDELTTSQKGVKAWIEFGE